MAREQFIPSDGIEIKGLKEFQTALKAIEDGAQKELKDVLNKGANIVVDEAQQRARGTSSRAAGAIRAASQQRAAIVKGGAARVPFYGWLDFGGTVGRGHQRGPLQGAIKRPFKVKGRFIYPAFDNKRDEVKEVLEKAFLELLDRHGLGVD